MLGRARLCRRRSWVYGSVQLFGGGVGCGGLGGVLLGFAEFGDGFGECGQPGDEDDRGHGAVAGQVGERGQQPGGLAELVPSPRRWRDTAKGRACGAVVGVGGLAQDAAAEHGGGRVQGVGGGPGGVGGGSRVGPGQVADLRCGVGGGAGGMVPDRVAFLGGEGQIRPAGCGPVRGPPLLQLGPAQIRLRVSRRRTRPVRRPWSVSPGRATEYPVT